MGIIDIVIGNFINVLESKPQLAGIEFLRAYPAVVKENPLRKVTVSVGMERMDLQKQSPGVGLTGLLRVRMHVHVPISDGGVTVHQAFSKIADAIVGSVGGLQSLGCSGIHYDRPTATIVLQGWVEITVTL